jgi:transcriptional regulator with XRE-family HTH domain
VPVLTTNRVQLGRGALPCQTELGKFVRARRLQLGLSQPKTAKLADLQESLLSRMEVGKTKRFRREALEKLAPVLQCEVMELVVLNGVGTRTEPTSEFGKFVRVRMKSLGLDDTDVGRRLGRTSRFRSAKLQQICGFRSLKKWARVLECDPVELRPFLIGRGFEPQPNATFGSYVRRRRLELGLSLQDVANVLDVTRQAVSLIEMGQTLLVTKPDSVAKLAQILQLKTEDLKRFQV